MGETHVHLPRCSLLTSCYRPRVMLRPLHVMEAVVVLVSLVLEIVFKTLHEDTLVELASLLIVFRLWRIIRVMHSTEEIVGIFENDKKGEELERLKKRIHELEALMKEEEEGRDTH